MRSVLLGRNMFTKNVFPFLPLVNRNTKDGGEEEVKCWALTAKWNSALFPP